MYTLGWNENKEWMKVLTKLKEEKISEKNAVEDMKDVLY